MSIGNKFFCLIKYNVSIIVQIYTINTKNLKKVTKFLKNFYFLTLFNKNQLVLQDNIKVFSNYKFSRNANY